LRCIQNRQNSPEQELDIKTQKGIDIMSNTMFDLRAVVLLVRLAGVIVTIAKWLREDAK
jgi:hypothetical protein